MYCPSCGFKNDHAARFCTNCGKELQTPPPSSVVSPPASGASPERGRGGLILAFGVLSVIMLGLILGIPAWVMANRDLKKMRSGKMETDQRGMTLAGMVLGIVGTFVSSGVIVFILVVTMATTATVVTFNTLKKGGSSQNLAAVSPAYTNKAPLVYYDGINQIRGKTADEEPATYLVRISLGYDPVDTQVSVEIDAKERDIHSVVRSLISQKRVSELSPAHYDALENELKDAINRIIGTGKIKSVVFREFTVVK